ncbi:MAG: hypothetical protein JWP35_1388 [Caulobacter sp.]|nr:hypothetical protein [Caulobacter sp.]
MQDGAEAERQAILAAYRAGALADVERRCGLILASRPDDPFALHLSADARLRLGRPDGALDFYDRLIAHGSPPPPVLMGRAEALAVLGRFAEARAAFDQALAVSPGSARGWRNLAGVLMAQGNLDPALTALDRALSLKPDYADALLARAQLLDRMGRPKEAVSAFDRLLELAPGHEAARYGRAVAALRAGRLEEGWPDLELRWKRTGAGNPSRYPKPLWLGQTPLRGKRLLIHQEQGFGDLIQLARYAPLAAAAGASVYLQVRAPAKALMETLKGIGGVFAPGEVLPDIDLQTPVFSLPLAFGTTLATLPAEVPYLAAPPERLALWQERLGPATRPRVGLAWAGNPEQADDHNRSMPLAALLKGVLPGLGDRFEFISLQKDLSPEDGAQLARTPAIRTLGGPLNDFADTAAVIAHCDLTISVCTSTAHLAGALGRPVWVMLSHHPDFRWMTARTDSPWYPSARLFRQPAPGDWEAVAAQVAQGLRDWKPPSP